MKKSKKTILTALISLGMITSSLTPAFSAKDAGFVPKISLINENKGVPTFIAGKLSEKSNESPEKIVEKYYSKELNSLPKKSGKSFRITDKFINSMGRTVVKTIQTYKGTPVFGTEKNIHINANGEVEVVSGSSVEGIEGKLVQYEMPSLASKQVILNVIEKHLGYKPEYLKAPQIESILYPVGDKYHFAVKVEIKLGQPTYGNYVYYIDAKDLSVLNVVDSTASATSTTGTGVGQYGNTVGLKLALDNGAYKMINMVENFDTYGQNVNGFTDLSICSSTTNSFNSGSEYQKEAVDAHYHVTKVSEFYKNYFNRNGFDNNGTKVSVYSYSAQSKFNSRGDPNGDIVFYGGKPTDPTTGQTVPGSKTSAAALDIAAHEFTHTVLFSEGLLNSSGDECAALHEGIADTFGTISEYALLSSIVSGNGFDWIIGEDTGAIYSEASKNGRLPRDLANPNINTYSKYLSSTNTDSHARGGVITKAANLIAEGGTHNGVQVTGIGISKLARIFYNAINDGYIYPAMTLKDFAKAAVHSADLLVQTNYRHRTLRNDADVTYTQADVQTVINAFTAVELLPKNLTTLFSDGFESGNFTSKGWVTSGTCSVLPAQFSGSYSAKLQKDSYIEKSINLLGYGNNQLTFSYQLDVVPESDALSVQWYDGSTWKTLESITNTTGLFTSKILYLPDEADNNSNFKLRFAPVFDDAYDLVFLDDVCLKGEKIPYQVFSDGFESANFTAGGWTASGNCSVLPGTYSGSYCAKLTKGSYIEKTLNLQGYSSADITFLYQLDIYPDTDALSLQWYNGTAWQTLESITGTSGTLSEKTILLPSQANNNPNFRIRFAPVFDDTADSVILDDVRVNALII